MNRTILGTAARAVALPSLCLLLAGCGAGTKTAPASNSASPTAKSDNTPAKPAEKPATPTAIEGMYAVTGTNPSGAPYKGDLEVIKHDKVYQFRWTAGKSYDGVGVLRDGVVAVSFCDGPDGKGCGVVCFNVAADGSMDGTWGMWGTDESGTEKATRTGGSGPVEGDYTLAGKNPDGTDYKATLVVTKAGAGYNLVWSNGNTGFGIRRGDALTVGFGGSKCSFVAYEVKPDGTLEGVWGGAGATQTGTETAKKK